MRCGFNTCAYEYKKDKIVIYDDYPMLLTLGFLDDRIDYIVIIGDPIR